jgi:hypothetical protein
MTARSLFARALACTAIVSLAAPALADERPTTPKSATEEGRERFRRGVELFKDGDYRAALIEFNRANEVAPNGKIHFNIAQTCLEMQDYACALRGFEKYLAEGGTDIPKDRRQQSERELERLKKLVGHVRITSNKDGADVTIDDIAAGKTPLPEPVLLGAGRHKITVSVAALAPATRVVDLAGGDKIDLALDLTAPPPGPPPADRTDPATPRVAPRAEDPRGGAPAPSRTPFWIGLVTTGVLGAGAGVTGALALSAKSDLDSTAGRFPVTTDEVGSARTKVQTFSTVTDVLLVSTVVAAAITTVLYFTTSPPSRSAHWRPRVTPLGGTF